MKVSKHFNDFRGGRAAFCEWYTTTMGQMLLNNEAKFIAKSIGISYKQLILQVGSLGWEDRFLDQDLIRNIIVLDRAACCHENTRIVWANISQVPIASESIDVVIMPHSLEFENDQHQVLREAERVLKPEGRLLVLGFNPWSPYGILHYLPLKRKQMPWCGRFISRKRLLDWLRLLNFETEISAGFYFKSASICTDSFENGYPSITLIAYAIRAIKRRYTLIPLVSTKQVKPRLLGAEAVENSTSTRRYG